jgi:hypothetical protein
MQEIYQVDKMIKDFIEVGGNRGYAARYIAENIAGDKLDKVYKDLGIRMSILDKDMEEYKWYRLIFYWIRLRKKGWIY